MLVDSHCHLQMLKQASSQEGVRAALQLAKSEGVEKMLCVACCEEDFTKVLDYARAFEAVEACVGLHPCSANTQEASLLSVLERYAGLEEVVALGETGLDYYHETSLNKSRQQEHFIDHMVVSSRFSKPLVVHTRNSSQDTIAMLHGEARTNVTGVFHCFVESYEVAKKILDLGFYVSFSGILTFKNAGALREVAQKLPKDRVLVETDSPYLAPVPMRGKENQPAYLSHVARVLAELWAMPYEDLCARTTQNYQELFYA